MSGPSPISFRIRSGSADAQQVSGGPPGRRTRDRNWRLLLQVWVGVCLIADLVGGAIGYALAVLVAVVLLPRPRPGIALALVLLITQSDIISPFVLSGQQVNDGLYTVSVGPMSGATLLILWVGIRAALTERGRAWLALPRLWRATALALGMGGASIGLLFGNPSISIASSMAPLIWLAAGAMAGSATDLRYTLWISLFGKASVVVGLWLAGIGLTTGSLLRPSFDSYWLALPILVAAGLLVPSGLPRFAATAGGVIAAIALALSYTRQAWIAGVIAIVLVGLRTRSTGWVMRAMTTAVIFLAAVGAFVNSTVAASVYADRLESIGVGLNPMSTQRDLRWDETVAVVESVGSSVVVGLGPGSTFSFDWRSEPILTEAAFPAEELATGRFSKAHLPLVTWYLSLGLAGVAGWLMLTALPWIRGRHALAAKWHIAVWAGTPLLLLGPWTSKTEFLAGVVVAILISSIQRHRERFIARGVSHADRH